MWLTAANPAGLLNADFFGAQPLNADLLGSVALSVKTTVDLVLLGRVVRSLLGQRGDVRSIFCICGRCRTSRAHCALVVRR